MRHDDAALGETDRYAGEQAQYNGLYAELAVWLRRTYPPRAAPAGSGERRDKMVLANRTELPNSRTLLRAFGGLNEGYGCSRQSTARSELFVPGLPGAEHPQPRRKLRTLTGLNGMYHLNGLLTVCGRITCTPDERARRRRDAAPTWPTARRWWASVQRF